MHRVMPGLVFIAQKTPVKANTFKQSNIFQVG